MWRSVIRTVLRALRWALMPSAAVSVLMGMALVANFYRVEAVDIEELCIIRTDGKGLIPLHDQFGPEVYCDPRWHVAAIFSVYIAARFFPYVLAAIAIPRFFFVWLRSHRRVASR